MFEHPADLREVLSQVPVVIHHGGVSTAQAGLVAGRPQVLLPRYLEQELVALALGNRGVATSYIGWVSAEEVVASLQDFREDQGFHRRARHLAEAIRGRGPCDGVARIAAACESLTRTAHRSVAGVPAGAGASRPADWSLVHAGSGTSTSSPGLLPAPLIVGAPRSGTTLLRMMVDSHPEAAIPSETVFLPAAIKASLASDRPAEAFVAAMYSHERWSDQHLDATEILAEIERAGCFGAAGRYELGEVIRIFYRMHARRAGKIRWGDKTPQYNHQLRLLGGLLPETRFIHLVRDGRDVALSIRSFWWGQKTVDEAAEWWSEQIAKTRRQAAEVEHYLEVRYEDLVRDPRRELHRICEYLELPWEKQMLDYQHRAASRMGE